MEYISEFLGMMILILLNDSVVANTKLNTSGMKSDNPSLMICIASGLAVFIPVCIFKNYSGAHFNPAVTFALTLTGQFPLSKVCYYVLSQLAGAFCGACTVWLLFMKHFEKTEDSILIRSVFCTAPSIKSDFTNCLSETIGTFILTFSIVSIAKAGMIAGTEILVFALVTSVGMSLGGLTGFAINPARDFAPRLAYSLLPIKNKKNDWGYCWIPILGPLLGAALAALVYSILPW